MPDRLLTYQLAAAVLAIWENDVRRFSPEEHFRWQKLLEHLPDDLTLGQLRDALAPIAARNDKEQALFATLFEQARADIEAVNEGTPDLTTFQKLSNLNPQHGFWKKYRWWFIGAILLLAALAAIFFWPEKKPRVVKKGFAVTAGKVSRICPGEFYQLDSFDSRISNIKINYVTTHFSPALVGLTDRVEKEGVEVPPAPLAIWNTHLAVITVENDTCISYTARDSVTGMDSIAALITFSNGQQCDLQLRVTVAPVAGLDTLTEGIGSETSITYLFVTHKPPFDHDQLLKNLEFDPADPLVTFLVRWANWLNAILLVVFAALLYWWVQWRARRRRKLVAQRDKSAKPPYVWNIRIKNLAPPDPGEAFGLTINSLRRRTEDETRLIDLSETVRATIRKGGMAAFRFRQQTRPPEYLMLVDRQNAHDHRARLYDDLYHIMRQNEVLTERFFFDGDIRLCHNEQYPDGLTLDELLFRFPAHRLLIISSGRQLFSATTGRLNKWTEQFARWKDRALLSPLSAADWGRRERALSELFRFVPASLPGLRWLLEDFEADEEQHTPQLEKLAALAIGEPVLLEEGDLLQTLEKHFPDTHTRTWIAACALWPELHYDLTLWIGHWLAQESGQRVATMARLSDLLRLPWFATGEMPDTVRAILIDWLRHTHPSLENRLRTALHALLEENAPPEDSAAWDDFAMRVAFNEWQFTTDPKIKKEREDQIARWIERNGDPDFIVIRELTGTPGPLDSILPESWKKHLYKGKLPGLGVREVWKDVLSLVLPVWAVLAGGLLWFWWNPQAPVCSGEQAKVVVGGDTISICAGTDKGRLLLLGYRIKEAAERSDSITYDSLVLVFKNSALIYQDTNFIADCLANAANAAFNAGLPGYRQADSLRQTGSGYRLNTSFWKTRACNWFDRAERLNISLSWVRDAESWCEDGSTTALPIPEIGQCRRIAPSTIALALRNRPLTLAEYNEVTNNRGGRLDRTTSMVPLPEGATVTLLDSSGISYRISFQGKTGYLIKVYQGKSTLLPCIRVVMAVPVDPSTTTTVALPEMVFVKGGTFTMGSPLGEEGRYEDEIQHQVTLSDYSIGKTEVTIEQYLAFCDETKTHFPAWLEAGNEYNIETGTDDSYRQIGMSRENKNYPVTGVSWDDAVAYCDWLSKKVPGKKYRLPSEAEWEYAARGGALSNKTKYSGSDNIENVAWYAESSGSKTHPAGLKKANELGIVDMTGNVWEWCSDWYGDYKDTGTPVLNPKGGKGGDYRMIRGGCWDSGARLCRVSARNGNTPSNRNDTLGFRLSLQ